MAQGSLTEVQSQVLIAKGLSYIIERDYQEVSVQTIVVHKLINGLIKGVMKIRNS